VAPVPDSPGPPTAPVVSVVIPVRDRVELFVRALGSVSRQTLKAFEVLVVDDGSTEDIAAALRSNEDGRFRYLRLPEMANAAVARNVGAAAALGCYVAYLDADDEWLPEHLERKVGLLEGGACAAVLSSHFVVRRGRTWEVVCRPRDAGASWPEHILSGAGDARSSALVFRRDALLEVGWDESLEKHQD